MGLFNNSKEDTSKLLAEMKVQAVQLARLESDIENVKQQLKSLRGLVNSKMKYDDEDIQMEIVKSNDPFDSIRRSKV